MKTTLPSPPIGPASHSLQQMRRPARCIVLTLLAVSFMGCVEPRGVHRRHERRYDRREDRRDWREDRRDDRRDFREERRDDRYDRW